MLFVQLTFLQIQNPASCPSSSNLIHHVLFLVTTKTQKDKLEKEKLQKNSAMEHLLKITNKFTNRLHFCVLADPVIFTRKIIVCTT